VVAGGGVAAVEACLGLRASVSEHEVDIDLVTPVPHFAYRPLSVLESFGGGPAWSMPLDRFAADQDLTLINDALGSVDADERVVITTSGARLGYDLLLVAIGAKTTPQVPGAITFRGSSDSPAVRRMLDEAAARLRPRIAFAVGPSSSWPLPLYELALLTARELQARRVHAELTLVTPEAAPLDVFGPRASALVARLLDELDFSVVCAAEPSAFSDGELLMADGSSIATDRVLALPRAEGRFVEGLPHDEDGFVPVDAHGRIEGLDRAYAAGDITDFHYRHGGLAAQQADAAAESILADLGLPIEPRPFSPVLQGVLFTGGEPAYLRAPIGERATAASEPRGYCLWWPRADRRPHLSSYLVLRAGAPRAPEIRPSEDVVPVRVELSDAGRRIHTPASAGT
jgi:sulfide:quinone oxidoreductase